MKNNSFSRYDYIGCFAFVTLALILLIYKSSNITWHLVEKAYAEAFLINMFLLSLTFFVSIFLLGIYKNQKVTAEFTGWCVSVSFLTCLILFFYIMELYIPYKIKQNGVELTIVSHAKLHVIKKSPITKAITNGCDLDLIFLDPPLSNKYSDNLICIKKNHLSSELRESINEVQIIKFDILKSSYGVIVSQFSLKQP